MAAAQPRPGWFWEDVQYGGILCDIGSHQIDQFLFYTGSTKAEIVAAQVANVRHPDHPHFQDFGDMMLRGDKGFGYVRLDWFTPDGLGTWGDGRLFVLGTDGYIEIRKYTNVAVSKQGNNLFLVDGKRARYIDCNNGALPFGPQFVADIVNRTHTAQDQAQCLLAAELSIRAQLTAKRVTLMADWAARLTKSRCTREMAPATLSPISGRQSPCLVLDCEGYTVFTNKGKRHENQTSFDGRSGRRRAGLRACRRPGAAQRAGLRARALSRPCRPSPRAPASTSTASSTCG